MLYKRGKVFWYEFIVNGKRYRKSTKRRNAGDAAKVESADRMRLLNTVQGIPTPTTVPTVSQFADVFMENVRANLSKGSATLHDFNVRTLKRFMGSKLLTDVTSKDVEDFKVWRSKQSKESGQGTIKPSTVNRCLATLKKMYYFAENSFPGLRNPVRHVKMLRESPGRIRVVTPEELTLYLSKADKDLSDYAILATETGGRPSELLSLHKDDIHLKERHVSLPGTKTRLAKRDIPLTDIAIEVLARRMKTTPNGRIFPPTSRHAKLKHHEIDHVSTFDSSHRDLIKKYFPNAPFVLYDFRQHADSWIMPNPERQLFRPLRLALLSVVF
jgi:integrase